MVVPCTKTQNMLSDIFHILMKPPDLRQVLIYLCLRIRLVKKKSKEYLLDKWLKSYLEKDIICKPMLRNIKHFLKEIGSTFTKYRQKLYNIVVINS